MLQKFRNFRKMLQFEVIARVLETKTFIFTLAPILHHLEHPTV